jgi:hypothetical protein
MPLPRRRLRCAEREMEMLTSPSSSEAISVAAGAEVRAAKAINGEVADVVRCMSAEAESLRYRTYSELASCNVGVVSSSPD